MRKAHPSPLFTPDLDQPINRSLSLIFTCEEIHAAFELIHRLQNSSDLSQICEDVQQLHAPCIEEASFSQKGTILGKLCFYSEVLLQAFETEDDDVSILVEEMQHSVSKLWRWKNSSRTSDQIAERLATFYREIDQKLHALFSLLTSFFVRERMNENLLMYLLEKKDSFNRFLGSRAIEELLHHLFPLGAEELRIILCEGYARRGFEDFYAEKESLIDTLEWESPCDPLLQTL